MIFHLFTDGSAIDNGKSYCVGAGALIIIKDYEEVYRHVIKDAGRGETPCTSIRMEMIPVIKGLEYIYDQFGPKDIVVYSDSAYLINCMTQRWYVKWQLNGWRTSTKEEVANQDLWLRLIAMLDVHRIVWKKVKGHQAGADLITRCNNECDRMARMAAREVFNERRMGT